jgi:hypothetical protein
MLPPSKLSRCAAAVRDELRAVIRALEQSGQWQGIRPMLPDGTVEPA